jgi:uracil-DNA glycosylase
MTTLLSYLKTYTMNQPENEWWKLLLTYPGWDDIESLYTSKRVIYPKKQDVFKCFELCPYHKTRVILLGQDPYINGEAMGLCFSVPSNTTIPPSLRNIFKELDSDIQVKRTNTDLTNWGEQGILLLNTSLTVFSGDSNSHKNSWKPFTTWLFHTIFKSWQKKLLIVMWGKDAQSHKIDNKDIDYIQSAHPSPFSANRGFFGSKPFSKINQWLTTHYQTTISF